VSLLSACQSQFDYHALVQCLILVFRLAFPFFVLWSLLVFFFSYLYSLFFFCYYLRYMLVFLVAN